LVEERLVVAHKGKYLWAEEGNVLVVDVEHVLLETEAGHADLLGYKIVEESRWCLGEVR
jgi:hypothetical protein